MRSRRELVGRLQDTWRLTAPFINAFLGIAGAAYFSYAMFYWFRAPASEFAASHSPPALEVLLLAVSLAAFVMFAVSPLTMRTGHTRRLAVLRATAATVLIWAVLMAAQNWRYAAVTGTLRVTDSLYVGLWEQVKNSVVLGLFGAYAVSLLWWTPAPVTDRREVRRTLVRLFAAINMALGVLLVLALAARSAFIWRERHQLIEDAAYSFGEDYNVVATTIRDLVISGLAIGLLLVSSWGLFRGKKWARFGTLAVLLFFLSVQLVYPGTFLFFLVHHVHNFVAGHHISQLLYGLQHVLLTSYLGAVFVVLVWPRRPHVSTRSTWA
jgi:hypothetical protein